MVVRDGICCHPRMLQNGHKIGIPQGGEGAGEQGGWWKKRGGKVNLRYPIIPYFWLWKRQEILSAEWIRGAGATHDSDS